MTLSPKKISFFCVKVSVAVLLIVFLARRIDWAIVLERLATVSIPLLVGYVFMQLMGNVISAWKWRYVASFRGMIFTIRSGFFAYLTGAFINNFFPSTIGGDAYRGLWLAQNSGARAAALASVVFDRFIGLWTTAVLALMFMLFFFESWRGETAFLVACIGIIVFLIGDAVLTYASFRPWFQGVVRLFPFQMQRLLMEIMTYTRRGLWFRSSLYSALFAFVGVAGSNYLLFLALGESVPMLAYLAIIFLVTIISSIPLSINNIGIKEWAYITFFPLAGVAPEAAITVALLSRFLQMCVSFGALPHYIAGRGERAQLT